jgi:hypothetical protein
VDDYSLLVYWSYLLSVVCWRYWLCRGWHVSMMC